MIKRFDEIDFDEAKKDVMPFIKNKEILEIWSDEFFIDITEQLRCND